MDGPRPQIEISELASALVEKAKQHKCSTFGLAAIKECVINIGRKLHPHASDLQLSPPIRTLEAYKVAIANRTGLIYVQNPRDKNLTREIAETSIRNQISMLHSIAATELIVGPEGTPLPDDAPDGCHWLLNLVRAANGGAIVTCRAPELKINTDDTKVFFFLNVDAADEFKDEVLLALSEDTPIRGEYSFHRQSEAGRNKFTGMSFWLTVSMSCSGFMAPIVLCVDGFS
jgi:hypothetical protein